MSRDINKWDARYRDTVETPPARVLAENVHLLPSQGRALDLACGLGANALVLAAHGLETLAWDSSAVAIERLRSLARARAVRIDAAVRDVVRQPPEARDFDVIVVSHFLDRSLTAHLIAALRPHGLLYYQTFTRTRITDSGPRSPAYLLEDGELLTLFAPLQTLVYREEGRVGDTRSGFRGQAMLVAYKPED
ncbi:MAG: methyltransferase domain-containing protein [Acidiferrobacterales bacterium]|nr:methyltransferase domain-containing protein [Acidiferrobacterales bacterium]